MILSFSRIGGRSLLRYLLMDASDTGHQPAAGKAGIAPLLAAGHHWPGLPEQS
jgi:hypothetical protein